MTLARHYSTQLLTRGSNFTIVYKHGSITVSSRARANQLFEELKVK